MRLVQPQPKVIASDGRYARLQGIPKVRIAIRIDPSLEEKVGAIRKSHQVFLRLTTPQAGTAQVQRSRFDTRSKHFAIGKAFTDVPYERHSRHMLQPDPGRFYESELEPAERRSTSRRPRPDSEAESVSGRTGSKASIFCRRRVLDLAYVTITTA